jgi:cyanophycinase
MESNRIMMAAGRDIGLRSRRRAVAIVATTALLVMTHQGRADQPLILMPIGGGYADTYEAFLQVAAARTQGRTLRVLVLPIAYANDPESLDEADRTDLDQAAEVRRAELESTCRVLVRDRLTCRVEVAPIYTRADALDPRATEAFADDLTAVYILGGNQAVAMRVVQDTPVEAALARAYDRGTLVGGTSAGGAIQSRTMIAGYADPELGPENGLQEGAVELWTGLQRRGLSFGLRDAILDQHFFQRDRLPRLLNAVLQPDVPHVGLGVDAYTGLQVHEGTEVERTFGLYTAAVLDAQTYRAFETARYQGPNRTLSVQNVLVHLMAPGRARYNLLTRSTSLAQPATVVQRDYDALRPPPGAGALLLAGGLRRPAAGGAMLDRFMTRARGNPTYLLFVTTAFTSTEQANGQVEQVIDGITATDPELVWDVVFAGGEAPLPYVVAPQITGVVVLGDDASLVEAELLEPVRAAWRRGVPVLAVDAAAAVLGAHYAPVPPSDRDPGSLELITQASFLDGNVTPVPGLGLMGIVLETRLLDDNRWGRLFSVAYHHPDHLALALPSETAIELTADGASVVGDNSLFVLDLHGAHLSLGTNDGYVIANGLLDVFAPGERLAAPPARSGFALALPLLLDGQELDPP